MADFISSRDGLPASPEVRPRARRGSRARTHRGRRSCVQDIFLTDGASKGVGFLLSLILRGGGSDGLLVPRYGEMWGDVGRYGETWDGLLVPQQTAEIAEIAARQPR